MNVTKIKDTLAEADKFETEGNELLAAAVKMRKVAQDMCPHSVTQEQSSYYGGSYLNKARTTYFISCAICGKAMGKRVDEHDWFG